MRHLRLDRFGSSLSNQDLKQRSTKMSSSTATSAETPVPVRPALPLEHATAAIGNATRWKILAALVEGEPLMVAEVAARVGLSPTSASKQLMYLRSLGAVGITRRLHHISKKLPQPRPNQIDFGYFVARFDVKA